MITFLIRRMLFMVVTVVFISMISFVLIELRQDPHLMPSSSNSVRAG